MASLFVAPPRSPAAAPQTASTRGSARLFHLDSLRGLLLAVMAINHIPSPLHGFTDHPLGFMSAAEGFVFMSGLIAGLVYTRRFDRSGAEVLQRACVSRAITLYLGHLLALAGVIIAFVAYAVWNGQFLANTPPHIVANPQVALLTGALLLYQPPLFDILPMYCGFMLLTPLLIRWFARGGRAAVIGVSALVWAGTNALVPQTPFATTFFTGGAFNISAWQLLFVLGSALGFSLARGERLIPPLRLGTLAALFAVAAVLFALRHAYLSADAFRAQLDWLVNKNNLAPLRLFNALILIVLLGPVAARFPRAFTWQPFVFLGRSSMPVFTAHMVLAYGIQSFPGAFDGSVAARWFGTAVLLSGMFLTAAIHTNLRSAPRPVRADAPDSGLANSG